MSLQVHELSTTKKNLFEEVYEYVNLEMRRKNSVHPFSALSLFRKIDFVTKPLAHTDGNDLVIVNSAGAPCQSSSGSTRRVATIIMRDTTH